MTSTPDEPKAVDPALTELRRAAFEVLGWLAYQKDCPDCTMQPDGAQQANVESFRHEPGCGMRKSLEKLRSAYEGTSSR